MLEKSNTGAGVVVEVNFYEFKSNLVYKVNSGPGFHRKTPEDSTKHAQEQEQLQRHQDPEVEAAPKRPRLRAGSRNCVICGHTGLSVLH